MLLGNITSNDGVVFLLEIKGSNPVKKSDFLSEKKNHLEEAERRLYGREVYTETKTNESVFTRF